MAETGILILALLLGDAAPRFATSEIEPAGGELTGHWFAELNGDGALDLVVTVYRAGRGRELEIHLQGPDGKFPGSPDRRVEIKRDIIACASADLRPEAGEELLLFTRSAVFSLATAREGYAGNAEKELDWDLVCEVPDQKRLPRLALPGATGELLAPAPGCFALLGVERDGDRGQLRERARFAVPADPSGDAGGKRRHIRIGLGSGLSGALERRRLHERLVLEPGAAPDAGADVIDSELWQPAPWLADVDADGDLDACLLAREGEGDASTLSLHLRGAGGGFAGQPDWSGKAELRGEVRLDDLDGDGKADLWTLEESDDEGSRLRFFRNRGVSFPLEAPDQVLKVSGRGVEARVADLDGDGRKELVISSIDVPAGSVLTEVKVTRTLLVFRGEPDGVVGRRPASRLEESFGAADFRGLVQRIRPGVAIGEPAARSALLVERDGALGARRFDRDLRLEAEPSWRFTPRRTILDVLPQELNGDGRADVVLRHLGSLTVLVSRP